MGYDENEKTKDFYIRTFKLIDQYDNFIKFKNEYKHLPVNLVENFEVTLLINCLFGTLCLPKNKWFNKLSDLKLEVVKKNPDIEIVHTEKKEITFKDLIISMRNGICHWEENKREDNGKNEKNIDFSIDNTTKQIVGISITGTCKDGTVTITINFKKIDALKHFLHQLKNIVLK